MLIFGASVNCIPWVYVPEILPLHVRAKGTAIGISANWIFNFLVVQITPRLLNNTRWKGYFVFMALNFAFVPLVYTQYPETTRLTLEEIDWLFVHPNVVKNSVKVAKHGWGALDGEAAFHGAVAQRASVSAAADARHESVSDTDEKVSPLHEEKA